MHPTFSSTFTFGVATSAYQVEGNIENDWSEWERAGRLKQSEMRCGRGVDHWNRYEEDFQLAKKIGATAFRMSLEWARIEPERGIFDQQAIADYRLRLEKMAALGLRPVVTLHHFTHPKWFHPQTPWYDPSSVEVFRRYARVCAGILKGLDAVVLTFNEPMVLLLGGYLEGVIPPGVADEKKAMAAIGNIARAHVAARQELVMSLGKVPIGISQNLLAFAPDRPWHPIDRIVSRLAATAYNHAFLRALCTGVLRIYMPAFASTRQTIEGGRDSLDFIGVNYYSRAHMRFIHKAPFVEFNYRDRSKRGLTEIGWEDYPQGLEAMLLEVKRYRLPVWISENGIDDRSGERRPDFIYQHLKSIAGAIDKGVDIQGYLYWSLLDNFEWLEGWGPRFGLYHVDFETLERRPTPACDYFKSIAEGRQLVPPNHPRADR